MKSKFFQKVNDYNLCTYYLLPLLKLNKYSFGAPQNFMESYVTLDGEFIVVKLRWWVPFLANHENYVSNYIHEDCAFIVFKLEDEFADDVAQFITGKYSQLSQRAKELIRNFSGLVYRQIHPKTNSSYTDVRLMAIEDGEDQRTILRNKLEDELGIVLPHEAELMSKPSDDNYIELTELQA